LLHKNGRPAVDLLSDPFLAERKTQPVERKLRRLRGNRCVAGPGNTLLLGIPMNYRWLVTLKAQTDVDKFLAEAKELGCQTSSGDTPIPMSDGECVVKVAASVESRDKLKELSAVRKVSPSSEMDYH
jgi:hypothetical protein